MLRAATGAVFVFGRYQVFFSNPMSSIAYSTLSHDRLLGVAVSLIRERSVRTVYHEAGAFTSGTVKTSLLH